mmetsp:Transcript_32267/g.67666  ORF Transcript_32267/g.67666 Transcript_32267/m.67666 type:complete len:778 (-) Transcript_32267:219-2552(-)
MSIVQLYSCTPEHKNKNKTTTSSAPLCTTLHYSLAQTYLPITMNRNFGPNNPPPHDGPSATPPPRVIHSDAVAATAKQSTVAPTKAATSLPSLPSKPKYKKRTKKYNNFNIFFMLERQLLLQSRGGGIDAIKNPIDTSNSHLISSKELHLPPLCRRYNHLPLSRNWFLELLANQNKKRPHRKSHGLIPFKELAQTIAKNYREIDDETQSFVNEVAKRLGRHWDEMEAIAAKERSEQENKGSAMVIHAGRGEKRKDAPVVSVAGVKGAAGVKPSLSQDEAATVQQLMGMKSNSPPQSHQAMPPAHFQQHHPFAPHPLAQHPMMNRVSENESERLRVELARAMNAKRDSEQRINMLKELMTQHSARTPQEHHRAAEASHMAQHHHASWIISTSLSRGLPTGHDQYLASLLAAAGGSSSLSSRPQPHSSLMNDSTNSSANAAYPTNLSEVEKALLKEALARRLVPSGAPLEALYPGAHAALHGHPPLAPPSLARTSSAPLKKRQRFSFEKSEDDEDVRKLKIMSRKSGEENGEEQDETDRASSERPRRRSNSFSAPLSSGTRIAAAADNRPASARSDEIGFYKDLYAQLLGPRHTPRHAPAPSNVTSTRDLALLDSVSHSMGGSRSITVEEALLENLVARGVGSSRHPPPPHLPPSHYTSPPAHLSGHYPPPPPGAYVALLSQLGARHHHPAAARPHHHGAHHSYPTSASPPAHTGSPSNSNQILSLLEMAQAASGRSQFGLSHNDIMDVWNEMNRDKGGDGGDEGVSERKKGTEGTKED